MPSLVTAPCWIDLSAYDLDAATNFYGSVFGWSYPPQHPDAGGWRAAMVGHEYAGGLSPRPEGVPVSMWTVFFGTSDIFAAVARATELGASAMMPPMPVVIDGVLMTTIALMVDPTGALFGLAQQGANPGLTHTGHGSALWFELASHDVESARTFYAALLNATVHAVSEVAPLDYATLRTDAGDFAGTMPVFPGSPDGVPSAWSVYFNVDDTDAAVAGAVAAGASLMMGPETMHTGRIAYLADPEGAVFGLIRPASADWTFRP